MKITIATNSGFCYGVKKAIIDTEKTLEKYGHIKALGELIHNPLEVERLKLLGLDTIYKAEEIERDVVIIRSHGEAKSVLDGLKNRDNTIINCTCPYVTKIHRIVNEYYLKKYDIIIIGDEVHAEVVGINGWCNNKAIIIDTVEAAKNVIIKNHTCVVSQTTFNTKLWDEIINILRSKSDKIVVFNTICNATDARQSSARELSKKVDIMIVIGGKNSSNSKKLYEICSSILDKTYFIESADELELDEIPQDTHIGITAGASTPDWVIKEIINKLEGEVIVNG